MNLLNLGCGVHRHPAWTNLDIAPAGPDVRRHDLRHELPFADGSFDAVYHSHVLEHLDPDDGERLIGECFRVLRAGGVLRVVVPDLEAIARFYLSAIDRLRAGDAGAAADHRWMQLEIFDQMVRSRSGGRMAQTMRDPALSNGAFIMSRMGSEFLRAQASHQTDVPSLWRRVLSKRPADILRIARARTADGVVGFILGAPGREAFREGWFRHSGEVHRWMYDSISLEALLHRCGFQDVMLCRADQSRIDRFASYGLDSAAGEVRKPDSLFCEAIRPPGVAGATASA